MLREYGNMSSAFVYFVLQAALADNAPPGWWWMSSFGAGFSCHGALLARGWPRMSDVLLPRRVEPEMLDLLPEDDPARDALAARPAPHQLGSWATRRSLLALGIDARPVRRSRIVELGAGDGSLLLRRRQRARSGPVSTLTLVDRQDLVSPQRARRFAALGWTVHVVAMRRVRLARARGSSACTTPSSRICSCTISTPKHLSRFFRGMRGRTRLVRRLRAAARASRAAGQPSRRCPRLQRGDAPRCRAERARRISRPGAVGELAQGWRLDTERNGRAALFATFARCGAPGVKTCYDAIIVGAGPPAHGGHSLGPAGWSVAVVEKQAFPRRKVCGECISATTCRFWPRWGSATHLRNSPVPRYASRALCRRSVLQAPNAGRPDGLSAGGAHSGAKALDMLLLARAREAGVEYLAAMDVRAIAWECRRVSLRA